MSTLTLSPVDEWEADALARQLVEMQPWQTLGYRAETLRYYLLGKQDDLQRLCLHVNGIPAGVMVLRTPWLRGTLLELLAVLPPFQQQGLGKWLMQWLLDQASNQHQRNLWTLVSAFNAPAIRFYQSYSFAPIGKLDDFIIAGQDELLLRRVLDN